MEYELNIELNGTGFLYYERTNEKDEQTTSDL
jgi:hypothetical protein